MAGKGGARKGAGRKPKVDEQKANYIMLKAIKEIHNKDTDEEAKIEFLKDLYDSQRGKIFLAEHLFGKAKDVVENLNYNHNTELTKEEAEAVAKALVKKYQ